MRFGAGVRQTLCSLGLAALVAGCGSEPLPTEPNPRDNVGHALPQSGVVVQAGRVLAYPTLSPMPGARMSFDPFDPGLPEVDASTDPSGAYRVELSPADYFVRVDGAVIGAISARFPSERAHAVARAEGCSALYGVVGDARSGAPLPGAAVASAGKTTTANADGWYFLDYGCGVNAGFGTMVATFSQAGRETVVRGIGRGLPNGARRMDVGLLPQMKQGSD